MSTHEEPPKKKQKPSDFSHHEGERTSTAKHDVILRFQTEGSTKATPFMFGHLTKPDLNAREPQNSNTIYQRAEISVRIQEHGQSYLQAKLFLHEEKDVIRSYIWRIYPDGVYQYADGRRPLEGRNLNTNRKVLWNDQVLQDLIKKARVEGRGTEAAYLTHLRKERQLWYFMFEFDASAITHHSDLNINDPLPCTAELEKFIQVTLCRARHITAFGIVRQESYKQGDDILALSKSIQNFNNEVKAIKALGKGLTPMSAFYLHPAETGRTGKNLMLPYKDQPQVSFNREIFWQNAKAFFPQANLILNRRLDIETAAYKVATEYEIDVRSCHFGDSPKYRAEDIIHANLRMTHDFPVRLMIADRFVLKFQDKSMLYDWEGQVATHSHTNLIASTDTPVILWPPKIRRPDPDDPEKQIWAVISQFPPHCYNATNIVTPAQAADFKRHLHEGIPDVATISIRVSDRINKTYFRCLEILNPGDRPRQKRDDKPAETNEGPSELWLSRLLGIDRDRDTIPTNFFGEGSSVLEDFRGGSPYRVHIEQALERLHNKTKFCITEEQIFILNYLEKAPGKLGIVITVAGAAKILTEALICYRAMKKGKKVLVIGIPDAVVSNTAREYDTILKALDSNLGAVRVHDIKVQTAMLKDCMLGQFEYAHSRIMEGTVAENVVVSRKLQEAVKKQFEWKYGTRDKGLGEVELTYAYDRAKTFNVLNLKKNEAGDESPEFEFDENGQAVPILEPAQSSTTLRNTTILNADHEAEETRNRVEAEAKLREGKEAQNRLQELCRNFRLNPFNKDEEKEFLQVVSEDMRQYHENQNKVFVATNYLSASASLENHNFDLVICAEAQHFNMQDVMVPMAFHHTANIVLSGDPLKIVGVRDDLTQNAAAMIYERPFMIIEKERGTKTVEIRTTLRMAPTLTEFVKPFYDGKLVSGIEEEDIPHTGKVMEFLRDDMNLKDAKIPVAFIDLDGLTKEQKCRHTKSSINEGSIKYTIELTTRLSEKVLKVSDMVVLVDYLAQASLLSRTYDKLPEDLRPLISTVDAYQGQSRAIVIYERTRTHSVGFTHDYGRLLTIFTRATTAYFILAVEKYMTLEYAKTTKSEQWKRVVSTCKEKNTWTKWPFVTPGEYENVSRKVSGFG